MTLLELRSSPISRAALKPKRQPQLHRKLAVDRLEPPHRRRERVIEHHVRLLPRLEFPLQAAEDAQAVAVVVPLNQVAPGYLRREEDVAAQAQDAHDEVAL